MNPLLIIAVLSAGGAFLLRRLAASARANLQRFHGTVNALDAERIRAMADECVAVFRDRLQVTLDLDDPVTSAASLDEAFRTQRPMLVLARDAYPMRALELAGAFLAELVRRHGNGEWRMDGGSPRLLLRRPDGEVEVRPFDKMFKHVGSTTRAGELQLWIRFMLGAPIARLSPQADEDGAAG
jgi:hypothetical protein